MTMAWNPPGVCGHTERQRNCPHCFDEFMVSRYVPGSLERCPGVTGCRNIMRVMENGHIPTCFECNRKLDKEEAKVQNLIDDAEERLRSGGW
jgi:hypothetical protein